MMHHPTRAELGKNRLVRNAQLADHKHIIHGHVDKLKHVSSR